MNERTLLIMATLGASIVAYVVYALLTRGGVQDQPAPVSTTAAAPDSVAPRREDPPPPPRSKPRVMKSERGAASAKSSGGPPAVPMPEVSLEEAREDYDDFIAELERELQRNEDTGKALANEHWVEYYRRGHEIMNPLRSYMSSGSEAEREEVGELDERLRTLMSNLQRDPTELKKNLEPLREADGEAGADRGVLVPPAG